jgi:tripartite ATP-independent transporter DctM subunit
LPYSLPLLVYCLVAHVDFTPAFKAVLLPGALVVVLLSIYAAFVATGEKVKREPPRLAQVGAALWELRWEAFIPLLLIFGLGSNLASIDEVAALVALYVAFIEFFVYRDLSWKKDLARIAAASMSLAGAIILILAMANALMNFVEDQEIPKQLLNLLLRVGIEHKWQLLVVMNLFLLVLGMLMEGFSAIFVAVPLIMPFVANLGERHPDEAMSPFQLAMIFLLNLELAYCMPPLGLNLFISSFRFNRSVTSLYKVVLPFAAILTVSLLLVSYVPKISTALIEPEIGRLRATAEKDGVPPREAWNLECVQLDPTDPKPCSPEDRAKYGTGHAAILPGAAPTPAGSGSAAAPNDDQAALEAALAAEEDGGSDEDGGESDDEKTDGGKK